MRNLRAFITTFGLALVLGALAMLPSLAHGADPHDQTVSISDEQVADFAFTCANVCQSVFLSACPPVNVTCPSGPTADDIVDRFVERKIARKFVICKTRRDGTFKSCKPGKVLVDIFRR